VSRIHQSPVRYRVGDRVKVPWHPPVVGEIVEDRGPLGRGGRHLYTVSFPLTGVDEPMLVEFPAEELEFISERKR
jgi:hypothetical protein